MLKTSAHSPSTCFKANCQIQFWISKGPAINWDYPVLLLSWSFSACVCLSRKRSSFLQEQDPTAEQSFHTLSILNPHNQEIMEEEETDIQVWLTFNAVFLIVRAMKSFFGLDLNNWSKINGEWSNYRQLWSKDRHCRWQMLGGRQGTKCPKKASISPNLVRCKSTICPGNGIFAERKTSDY